MVILSTSLLKFLGKVVVMNIVDRFFGVVLLGVGCLFLVIGSLINGPVADFLRWVLIIGGWVCAFLGCRSYNIRITPEEKQGSLGYLFGLSFVLLVCIGFFALFRGSLTPLLAAGGLFIAFVAGGMAAKVPAGSAPVDGWEYEHYCAEYLRQHGFFNVQVTPASGDFGADIVAYDVHGDKWVFQCKRFSKPVDNTAVQEVNTAKKHYGAKKGAVMTNTVLTEKARQLAWENDIELFEMID